MLTAHLSGVNSQCSAHEAMKPTWHMAAILPLPFPFSFSHMKPTPTAHTSSFAPSQKLALTLHPMLHKLAHMSLNAEQLGVNCPPIRSYLTKPKLGRAAILPLPLLIQPHEANTYSPYFKPAYTQPLPLPPPLPACILQLSNNLHSLLSACACFVVAYFYKWSHFCGSIHQYYFLPNWFPGIYVRFKCTIHKSFPHKMPKPTNS